MEIATVSSLSRSMTPMVIGLLTLSMGCAMRVTGVVRDSSTRTPIGGAVLTANDGRKRLSTTDPNGNYAVKTDWRRSSLLVSAPGYSTTTVPVPDSSRFPVVDVYLDPAVPSATGVVSQIGGSVAPVRSAGVDPRAVSALRDLQDLYDRGVISNDEYRRTRNRIIDGL